jgi:hypothetical protein
LGLCFALKTLGKNRGYVERQEITGKEGGPVQNINYTIAEWQAEQQRRRAEVTETLAIFDDDETED